MKTDLHTHVKLTSSLHYSQAYVEHMFLAAKQAGLDAICLTEHCGSIGLNSIYQYIQNSLTKYGDCYLYEGLKVFTGIEVDIAESGHILVIGALGEILSIYEELQERGIRKKHPNFEELLKIIKHPSLLKGAAHPFRVSDGNLLKLSDSQIRQLDFVELNGKDYAQNMENTIALVYAMAKRTGLPVVAGSDTHYAFQYGCSITHFEEDLTTIDGIKHAITQSAYTIEHSEFAKNLVRMSAQMKKALIKVHELGGDYLSLLT